jgi:alpha-amylase
MYESMANMGDTNNITRYYTADDMKAAGISNIAGGGLYHWSWVPVFNQSEEPEPMWWLFQQHKTELTVEPAEAEMPTNSTLQLTASKDAVWTSSDDSIATVDENGLVTALRDGKVTITAEADGETAESEIQTRFYDVNDRNQYYYNPVYWAADNGITTGYDKVYFGPQQNCTRRELSIFLWRLAGKPSASGALPFSDLGKYTRSTDTYKAILWCYNNGIVKGYGDGTFKPDAPIVRKDTMIMLYRLAGKPGVSGTLQFPDARALGYGPDTDTYRSIVWGTQLGITKGYSDGTFKPLANCLREHIVTFVYRYAQQYSK